MSGETLPAAERAAIEAARERLAATGQFAAEAVRTARLTRLQGLTNRVYKVEIGDGTVCLRIPGPGTAAIIDRQREEHNARAAAGAGIAPPVLYFDPDGTMLTPYLAGVTLTGERFRADPGAVARTAAALRGLHGSAVGFAGSFDPFELLAGYMRILRDRGADIPDVVPDLLRRAEVVRVALSGRPAAPRPCHCDPTGANLLDAGDRIWLIDWEYSGMNDPAWDLAYLSIMSDFDAELDRALLAAYLGREPAPAEAARMGLQQAAVELFASLWALVQQSAGNRAGDYPGYAARTLAQCEARMRSPGFAAQVATVRGG